MDNRRYYGLDALRGTMMMLGIVLHASIYYVADPPLPIPTDSSTSPVFDVLVVFIHSFRMPLFFVLAGFFAALLLEKYGLRGSYVNRAKRILAPFALGMVTIVPVTGWIAVSMLVTLTTGERQLVTSLEQLQVVDFQAMADAGLRNEPSPIHLWFLWYLMLLYLTIPLCRAAVRWSVATGLEPRLRRWAASPWAMPVFGLVTAATLWPFPAGLVIEGFMYFVPHVPSLLYYGVFFVLGFVLHHYREVLDVFTRHLGYWVLASLVLFPAAVAVSMLELTDPGAGAGIHAAAVILHGLATWALIYAFTGLFLKLLDFDSPWSLYISQSSYWVYLLHMPVVTFVAWFLVPWDLPASIKFSIDVAVTALVCFTSYHYLVRRTWVSVLLNGRRFDLDWPWSAARPRQGTARV